MSTPPSLRECQQAVKRAEEGCRRKHLADPNPRYAGPFGPSVAGYVQDPREGEDGWWRVGYLMDCYTSEQLGVWYQVDRVQWVRRLRLEREEPERDPDAANWVWKGN